MQIKNILMKFYNARVMLSNLT